MGNSQWRNFEPGGNWSRLYRQQLIEEIAMGKNVGKVENPRVLIFGPIQSGKSSLINSVATIDENRIARVTIAERGDSSCTQELMCYQPSNVLKNFVLLDVMGLEASKGLHENYTTPLLKGRILPDFKFNPDYSLTDEDKKLFRDESGSIEDVAHCNVFVLNAKQLKNDTFEDELIRRINAVQKFAKECNVVTIIVLTNIDEVCKDVAKDVSCVYTSEVIKELVQKAERCFGIQEMNIFPIKNYTKETHPVTNMDILILLAIRAIVHCTMDRIKKLEHHKTFSRRR